MEVAMNIKKLLSLALVFVLISITPINLHAQDLSGDNGYAVKTVTELALMPYASEINDTTFVTRSQLVTSILHFMGVNVADFSSGEEYPFEDVDYSKSYAKDITAACSLGLVKGISATQFAPDDNASLHQAVTVLTTALGYKIKAESCGGYPTGYMTVASQLDLFEGVSGEDAAAVSTLDFAKLMYNALEAPLFEQVSYGDVESYDTVEETPLTKFLDYKCVEGVVTETSKVNLYGNIPAADDGCVYVGSTLIESNGTDIENYVGYRARVYCLTSDTNDDLLAKFFMTEGDNKVLGIECDAVSSISYSGSSFKITYTTDGEKEKNLSVVSASCLYNGYPVAQSDIDALVVSNLKDSENYSLTLVDNNLDGSYEVVKIDNHTSYVVKRVNTYSEIIYCYDFDDSAALVPVYINPVDDDTPPYRIYKSDKSEISLADIEVDTVISVYENLTGTHRDIYVSDNVVTGKVTEVSQTGYCTIDGENYKVDKSVTENLLGVSASFFIDISGKIIGRKTDASSLDGYGFLMDVHVPGNGGFANYPRVKILTAEGDMREYEAEKEIVAYNPYSGSVEKTPFEKLVNTGVTPKGYGGEYDYMIWHEQNSANFTYDTKYSDYSKQFYWRPWLSDEDKSDIASRKPIYYKINSDGRIVKIIVPDIPDGENRITLLNNNNRYTFTYNSTSSTALDESASTTGNVPHYRIAKDATVFSVLAVDYDDDDYSVPSQGVSIIPNGASRKMELYSVSDDTVADLIVAYSYLPYENVSNMQYVVVDSATRMLDDTIKLRGFSQGKEYVGIINPDTRLVERILNSSNSEYNSSTKVTASNILNFRSYSYGGSGIAPYDIATSTSASLLNHPDLKIGSNTPYADETSLKKGDIVLIGKNRGETICYVEMAMRAADCVMLIPQTQDDWYGRLNNSSSYFKGVVTALSGYDEVYLRIVGEYTGSNQRKTTEAPNYRLTALFDDRNAPYDFSSCKYVWIYDYNKNRIEVVDSYAIEVGDVIVGRGSATSPKDCIILKNYPAEPEFDYWVSE